MSMTEAEKTLKALQKMCSECKDIGPACWNCEIQVRKDRLINTVLLEKYKAKQGLNPDEMSDETTGQ